MWVRVRPTTAGPWGVILAGKEGEVPEKVGLAMVATGTAVKVTREKAEPAPAVETATAEPPENAMMPPARRRKRRGNGEKMHES